MTDDDALAAAHRAANGVLRDWMRSIGIYERRAELPEVCRSIGSAEVVWLTLRPDRRVWAALGEREQVALEVFVHTLARARLRVIKAVAQPAPVPRGYLAERIGDDEDRMPGLADRDRLR